MALIIISIICYSNLFPPVSHNTTVHAGARTFSRPHPNYDMRVPLFEYERNRITYAHDIITVHV